MHCRSAGRAITVLFATTLVACHGDAAPTPDAPSTDGARLIALSGDHVNADPGAESPESLTVALLNGSGRRIPGMRITWTATSGGTVQDASTVTDENGLAHASWIFANGDVSQTASASFGAAEESFHGLLRQSPDIPIDTLLPVELTTFDGSNQVVHPDVMFLPRSWSGGSVRLAMAITPYPNGDQHFENPSLYVSDAGATWTMLATARNPVVRPEAGYLSDPSLVFETSTQLLLMYYREVSNGDNVILRVGTPDGAQWGMPLEVIRVPSDGLVSPSVVRRSATNWFMWSVNAGLLGCSAPAAAVEVRHSVDGTQWDAPIRVALDQPGGYPWHIDVNWIPALHEYWALYNLKSPGNCVTPAVYLATSPDGVQWTTYPRPVLQRGAIDAFADVVYRSSFIYTKADDMVTLYYSGARWDGTHYVWSAAVQRRTRAALFASIQAPGTFTLRPPRSSLPNPEGALEAPLRVP